MLLLVHAASKLPSKKAGAHRWMTKSRRPNRPAANPSLQVLTALARAKLSPKLGTIKNSTRTVPSFCPYFKH